MLKKKVEVSIEETVIDRKVVTMEVDASYGDISHNLLKGMVKVNSTWAFKFVLWLLKAFPYTETILFTTEMIGEFRKAVQEMGGDPPSHRTVQWVLAELVENGIVQRTKMGYRLDTRILWNDSNGNDTEGKGGQGGDNRPAREAIG